MFPLWNSLTRNVPGTFATPYLTAMGWLFWVPRYRVMQSLKKAPISHFQSLVHYLLLKRSASAPYHHGSPPSAAGSLPNATDSLAGANDSPPPSAAAAPRTSHSLEPINEPVSEPFADQATSTTSTDQHSNIFQIDSHITAHQGASVPDQRFRMNWDWEPRQEFSQRCRMQGVNLALFDAEAQEQILGEFRSYWSERALDKCSHGQWEHKLAQQLKREAAKTIARDNQLPASPQSRRAAVSSAVMDIQDTD